MAGSGKGRGRAAFTFNIEAIGFAKGETLPEVAFKPPPLFPPTDFKPVPLKMGEEEDYMLALKQEFRASMKKMPYFMQKEDENQGIEKYSKKYLQMRKESMEWTPGGKMKKAKVATPKSNVDVLKKIEELEKKGDEEKSDEEKEKEKDKEGEEEEEEAGNEQEEYDEEDHEEENDYIASYFEDGDDFGAGSDDNMDEATY
ncbi:DNA-directed RNA polymerase III subunit RPC7 isoform X3 [Chelonoidis abingdonii]|uniref:DNA-directed RNA polymerase III subunit RPC7 isoform X3 n=1 Tax=Chelonoidis abingdonii TaxID=106734 RepID=UPI003F493153